MKDKERLLYFYAFSGNKEVLEILEALGLKEQALDLRDKTQKYVENEIKYILKGGDDK